MSDPTNLPAPTVRRDGARPCRGRWLIASLALHGTAFAALATCLRPRDFVPTADAILSIGAPAPVLAAAPERAALAPLPDVPRDVAQDAPALDADEPLLPPANWEPDAATARVTDRGTIGLGSGTPAYSWAAPAGRGRIGGPSVASGSPPQAVTVQAPPPPPSPAGVSRAVRFALPPEPPPYPDIARRRGWEGAVRLHLAIGADGSVLRVDVTESSGRTVLDDAAVECARAWRLEPELRDGRAVESALDYVVKFRLE